MKKILLMILFILRIHSIIYAEAAVIGPKDNTKTFQSSESNNIKEIGVTTSIDITDEDLKEIRLKGDILTEGYLKMCKAYPELMLRTVDGNFSFDRYANECIHNFITYFNYKPEYFDYCLRYYGEEHVDDFLNNFKATVPFEYSSLPFQLKLLQFANYCKEYYRTNKTFKGITYENY